MKRLFCVIFALMISLCLFCVAVNAEEDSEGADRIYTLFGMSGGFITENPIDTSDTTAKPWLLVGKDVFMTENGGYPAPFDNTYDKASFYYLAGSNSIEWLISDKSYYDNLASDFVVEYVVDYNEGAEGQASIALAYNYDYYIEAYVSPDGCGDIAIVTPSGRISVLSADSILNVDDPSELLLALSGEGKTLPDRLAVSIKVSLGHSRMPDSIELYVNGLLVGKTNGGFAESVDNLSPEYKENGAFPKDKLGNIVALKILPGAKGSINSIYIYSLGESGEPDADAKAYYAEVYGNASFEAETEETVTEKPEAELPLEDLDADMNVVPRGTIITISLIMAGIAVVIAAILLVILILRKNKK